MPAQVERLASLLITISAIAIAAVVIKREFLPAAPYKTVDLGEVGARYIEDWSTIASKGRMEGVSQAPITIVEFTDLECPYCKRFHEETLPALATAYPGQVALSVHHFPLSFHRFAIPAARAAECGASVGRFGAVVGAIYRKQDSLGLRSWAAYGRDANVADTASFSRCASLPGTPALVDSGLAIGSRLGVTGTPSIMINGWLFNSPPNLSLLTRTIDSLLAGRSPFPSQLATQR